MNFLKRAYRECIFRSSGFIACVDDHSLQPGERTLASMEIVEILALNVQKHPSDFTPKRRGRNADIMADNCSRLTHSASSSLAFARQILWEE